MGSGKSTVARALAQILNWKMIDLDVTIESAEGRSPRTIIEQDGEQHFRELETKALSNLLQHPIKQVISLGGGAWILEENREQIREHGAISVWLDAPFELCWKRIAASTEERPLARNEATARKLFFQRASCYELADLRISVTEQESSNEIAVQIFKALAPPVESKRESD